MTSDARGASTRAGLSGRFDPHVHGARGLFACMVVVFHVANSRLATFQVLRSGLPFLALRSFEHGVELFFGISGVVILGALTRSPSAKAFWFDRLTRIYPVLWPTVIVLAILANLSHYEGRSATNAAVLVANLFGLVPIFPLPLIHPAAWSLSYELAFYGLCGLTLVGASHWRRATMLIAVLAGLWLLAGHVRAVLMPVGLLVAYLVQTRRLQRFATLPELWLILFLTAWEALSRSVHDDLMSVTAFDLLSGWRPLLVLIAILAGASFFLGLMGGKGLLCRLLRTPPLQWLGTISYSLYLWHPIVMSMIKHAMITSGYVLHLGSAAQLGFLLIGAPPSILCAWLSQQVLEKRLTTALRRVLEGRRRAAQPAATSHSIAEVV